MYVQSGHFMNNHHHIVMEKMSEKITNPVRLATSTTETLTDMTTDLVMANNNNNH